MATIKIDNPRLNKADLPLSHDGYSSLLDAQLAKALWSDIQIVADEMIDYGSHAEQGRSDQKTFIAMKSLRERLARRARGLGLEPWTGG